MISSWAGEVQFIRRTSFLIVDGEQRWSVVGIVFGVH